MLLLRLDKLLHVKLKKKSEGADVTETENRTVDCRGGGRGEMGRYKLKGTDFE